MTTLAILSVRDRVAETFGRPFFAPNVQFGVRSLRQEVNNPESGTLFSNADDFDLFELGTFDDQSGSFNLLDHPSLVVRVSNLQDRSPKPD